MTSFTLPDQMRFRPGKLFISSSCADLVREDQLNAQHYLERHLRGDWGDVSEQRQRANDYGVEHGEFLMSQYVLTPTSKLWIITEGDRSMTHLILVPRIANNRP